MMSRYILIEFEDDARAEDLVIRLKDKSGLRVAGVFQRPNSWCKCPFQINGVNRPVERGAKFGWWVCQWCNKSRPGTHQLLNQGDKIEPRTNARRYSYGVESISIYEVPNPHYEE